MGFIRSKNRLGYQPYWVRPKKYGMMGIFLKLQYLTERFWVFFVTFFRSESTTYQHFHLKKMGFIITKFVTLYRFPASKGINWIYPPPTGKWRNYKDKPYWNYNPAGDWWLGVPRSKVFTLFHKFLDRHVKNLGEVNPKESEVILFWGGYRCWVWNFHEEPRFSHYFERLLGGLPISKLICASQIGNHFWNPP